MAASGFEQVLHFNLELAVCQVLRLLPMKAQSKCKKDLCGNNWEKANLSEESFVECHAGLPFIQAANKALILSVLSVIVGVSSALSAIFATGLIGQGKRKKNGSVTC